MSYTSQLSLYNNYKNLLVTDTFFSVTEVTDMRHFYRWFFN